MPKYKYYKTDQKYSMMSFSVYLWLREFLQNLSQKWTLVLLEVLKKDCATLENWIDLTKRHNIKDEIAYKFH